MKESGKVVMKETEKELERNCVKVKHRKKWKWNEGEPRRELIKETEKQWKKLRTNL